MSLLTIGSSAPRKRIIYLDYASATPIHPDVRQAVGMAMVHSWANPSSLHDPAREVRRVLRQAHEQIASIIHARPEEIFFASGGTEANNLAVLGIARALQNKGRHIVTSAIEHPSLLNPCRFLEEQGFEVTYVGVDANGRIDVDNLSKSLRPDTILVSIMWVNNEVGTIQPIENVVRIAHRQGILVHTDAVQAFGKLPVHVGELGIDALSVSAHKIYGPKGIGFLYLHQGTPLVPLMFGGDQEWGRRPGTESIPAIAGFAQAVLLAYTDLSGKNQKVASLHTQLKNKLTALFKKVQVNSSFILDEGGGESEVESRLKTVNGRRENSSFQEGEGVHEKPNTSGSIQATGIPHILNVSFPGVEGESLILGLAQEGVCVTSGSACSSAVREPSHVLKAMGCPPEVVQGSLRFSLSHETTEEEIDLAVQAVEKVVHRLQNLSPFV